MLCFEYATAGTSNKDQRRTARCGSVQKYMRVHQRCVVSLDFSVRVVAADKLSVIRHVSEKLKFLN